MRVLLLLSLPLLSACAGLRATDSQPAGYFPETTLVHARPEAVWLDLLSAYRVVGLPLTEVDAERLVLASSYTIQRPTWISLFRRTTPVRCTLPVRHAVALNPRPRGRVTRSYPSYVPLASPPGLLRLSVVTRLTEEGDTTRVESTIHVSPVGLGASPDAASTYCISTRVVERQIHRALRGTEDAPA